MPRRLASHVKAAKRSKPRGGVRLRGVLTVERSKLGVPTTRRLGVGFQAVLKRLQLLGQALG